MPDQGDINRSYQWAIQTCNAPNVGYSQGYRNQVTRNGITYYDCSSFIWYALKAGGFHPERYYGIDYPFVTADMLPVLLAMGFQDVGVNGQWLPGDIMLRKLNEIGDRAGHVEMVYQGGNGSGTCMGAHWDFLYDEYGNEVWLPLEQQVSIAWYQTTTADWRHCLRWGNGASGLYGASLYVVAAILGNWYSESNINPGIWERGKPSGDFDAIYPAGGGFGLGQWTNTSATNMRLQQMHDWMVSQGYSPDDGTGQIAYFIHEGTWYTHPSLIYSSQYSSLDDFLQSTSTNLEDLTYAFCEGWEGIHDSSWEMRYTHAQDIYQYLLTHANTDLVTHWINPDRYLTVSEIYNNAIMAYRLLSSGGGGGGNPWRRRGMPLYMMLYGM